jgi:hypothetical protein
MKKFAAAALLSIALAAPALASVPAQQPVVKHHVTKPRPVHATNPYLKHANHKAKRGHYKKF